MTPMPLPLLILGGNGRIGRALRGQSAAFHAAGLQPVWQSRRAASGFLDWDILVEPCPANAASGIVLCLAGVVRGSPDALAQNKALAIAAYEAARSQGGQHVFLVSSAAVYGNSGSALTEQTLPAPIGAYGQAKLAMEQTALGLNLPDGPGLTILRIGNIAGLDTLLGGLLPNQTTVLDPVSGQKGGPIRSYIGPQSLCLILAQLAGLVAKGRRLPRVLNIATARAIAMGDLLDAAGVKWTYGPPNRNVIAKVELDVSVLADLVDLPSLAGHPETMVAEWRGLTG